MKYENNTVKSARVRELIRRAGISIGDFSKSLWGANSHNSLAYFDARPDVKVSTLVRIAEILGCSIEEVLIKSDSSSDTSFTSVRPDVGGSKSESSDILLPQRAPSAIDVGGSKSESSDITTLKAELKALKMLIEEKDKRIEDLKSANSELGRRLDIVLRLRQERDDAK